MGRLDVAWKNSVEATADTGDVGTRVAVCCCVDPVFIEMEADTFDQGGTDNDGGGPLTRVSLYVRRDDNTSKEGQVRPAEAVSLTMALVFVTGVVVWVALDRRAFREVTRVNSSLSLS